MYVDLFVEVQVNYKDKKVSKIEPMAIATGHRGVPTKDKFVPFVVVKKLAEMKEVTDWRKEGLEELFVDGHRAWGLTLTFYVGPSIGVMVTDAVKLQRRIIDF